MFNDAVQVSLYLQGRKAESGELQKSDGTDGNG